MNRLWRVSRVAVICFVAVGLVLSGCGDDPEESENSQNQNVEPNQDPNQDQPETCEEEFQYEGGDVEEDLRLVEACSPYTIGSDIRVNEDATLTIDPGVTLQFEDGVDVRIGHSSSARLVAVGTDEDEIVFESVHEDNASPGDWAGIAFRDGSLPGTELEHVVIRHAGDDDATRHEGCVTATAHEAGRVSIENTTFEQCDAAGIRIENELDTFENNTFRDMSVAIDIDVGALHTIDGLQTYENVDGNRFDERTLDVDTTLWGQDVPWTGDSELRVEGDEQPFLTMKPGTHIQFSDGNGMRVGHDGPGGLIIDGEEDNEVLLEGGIDDSGSWAGIVFRPEAMTNSHIDHAIFRNGGQDETRHDGCLTLVDGRDERVSVTNTTFEGCERAAVYAESWFENFDNNTFVDGTVAIRADAGVVGSIAENQTFQDIDRNQIFNETVDRDSVWPAFDIPWRISREIRVGGEDDPVLTIADGAELQFDGDTGMRVGHSERGGLEAEGGVVFTSSEPGPIAGSWPGIVFRPDTLNGSYLDGVEIEYAGEDATRHDGAVTVEEDAASRVEITNSVFRENARVDVAFECGHAPTLSGNEQGDGGPISTTECP